MKKTLLSALAIIVVALIARLAVQVSCNALHMPALFGVLFGASLLYLAFSDYSRKPRFRGRAMRNPPAHATRPATSPEVDAASAWTHTTFSA